MRRLVKYSVAGTYLGARECVHVFRNTPTVALQRPPKVPRVYKDPPVIRAIIAIEWIAAAIAVVWMIGNWK